MGPHLSPERSSTQPDIAEDVTWHSIVQRSSCFTFGCFVCAPCCKALCFDTFHRRTVPVHCDHWHEKVLKEVSGLYKVLGEDLETEAICTSTRTNVGAREAQHHLTHCAKGCAGSNRDLYLKSAPWGPLGHFWYALVARSVP